MSNRYQGIKSPYHSREGFTLLEVLIAITILSIGLLGLAGMSTTAIRFNYYNKNRTIADTLAQRKMEELKRMALSTALTNADNTTENDIDENGVGGNGIFTRNVTVVGGAGELTILTVTVIWTDNSAHTVTLTTRLRQS